MMTEELEFAISQYVDGTLPASERAALELRLEGDAEARAMLAEYRRLEASLQHDLPAVPELDWDRLASHISATITDEAERPLAMPWVRRFAPLAVAASLIIGVGVPAIVYLTGRETGPEVIVKTDQPDGPSPTAVAVVEIEGPAAEAAPEGQQVAQVEIGPSPQYAELDRPYRAADVVVSRPSRVVWIASGADPAQDGRYLPY